MCVDRSNVRAGWGSVAAAPAVPTSFDSLRMIAMLDVAMVALGVGFFVAAVLYVLACERM
jgi:predicted membrane-bound dolichyl-phosphate-mannose-protein mannosyltransferase